MDGTSISVVVWEGIPQFVIDELIDQNADIIVLTELFQHSTIGYFWAEMERAGYQHAVTQNNGTNEVGILWKRTYTLFMQWMIRWLQR